MEPHVSFLSAKPVICRDGHLLFSSWKVILKEFKIFYFLNYFLIFSDHIKNIFLKKNKFTLIYFKIKKT